MNPQTKRAFFKSIPEAPIIHVIHLILQHVSVIYANIRITSHTHIGYKSLIIHI